MTKGWRYPNQKHTKIKIWKFLFFDIFFLFDLRVENGIKSISSILWTCEQWIKIELKVFVFHFRKNSSEFTRNEWHHYCCYAFVFVFYCSHRVDFMFSTWWSKKNINLHIFFSSLFFDMPILHPLGICRNKMKNNSSKKNEMRLRYGYVTLNFIYENCL